MGRREDTIDQTPLTPPTGFGPVPEHKSEPVEWTHGHNRRASLISNIIVLHRSVSSSLSGMFPSITRVAHQSQLGYQFTTTHHSPFQNPPDHTHPTMFLSSQLRFTIIFLTLIFIKHQANGRRYIIPPYFSDTAYGIEPYRSGPWKWWGSYKRAAGIADPNDNNPPVYMDQDEDQRENWRNSPNDESNLEEYAFG